VAATPWAHKQLLAVTAADLKAHKGVRAKLERRVKAWRRNVAALEHGTPLAQVDWSGSAADRAAVAMTLQRRVAVVVEATVGNKAMLSGGFAIVAPEKAAVTVQDHAHNRGRTGVFSPCSTSGGLPDPVRDICLLHTGGADPLQANLATMGCRPSWRTA
jgi:hypothetical protein